ncbi:IS4 family transposase [Geosporobacter subterraneus]
MHHKFLKNYKVASVLKSSNVYKQKGVLTTALFQYIFKLIFLNRSMYMTMLTEKHTEGFGKDTIYRFLNFISVNWIRFTSLLSARIVATTIEKLTNEDRVNVLILDDMMFERNSSKKVELLSKMYDHAKKSYKLGFRLLTLGWSDGNTFLPVNRCLLSSENRKNRIVDAKSLNKRTAGYCRRRLAQTKATSDLLELIDQAKKAGLSASYVLFDSWFCFPASIIQIKKRALDVIAMVKKTPKMHFLYNGKMQPITEIYKQNRKRRGCSKYLLSVEVTVVKNDETVPAKIIYVRNKNKKKDYLALITTDMSISEEETLRIYGKRWNIEVFFKVCKSYLKLGKECNSLSYDAMTAHAAVVFTRYMMLAVENRQALDNRTLGEIFYLLTDELADITWTQALQMLMQTFINAISDKLSLSADQIEELMDAFLTTLPNRLKERFALCA